MTNAIQKLKELNEHELQVENSQKFTLVVGSATCEDAAGARDLIKSLRVIVKEKALENVIKIKKTGCTGRCDKEPILQVLEKGKEPVVYQRVTAKKINQIIDSHIINHDVLEDWVL